jgi:hypothetical protein
MKKVFVIGNGFDLDLGFKTRYRNFASCGQFWPFRPNDIGLAGFLFRKAETERWLDIERCLLDYAKPKPRVRTINDSDRMPVEADKDAFEKLTRHLNDYIKRIPYETRIKTDSIAAKVLDAVSKNGGFLTYSFNYTDLGEIADRLHINRVEYTHIHGAVNDESIILGIDAINDVLDGYDFLYKVYDPRYRSNRLRHDLEEAEEIVIFGHSLGEVDYSYFQTFFRSLCREENKATDRKTVTIFTYDDSSRLSILRQLREMNDKKVQLMFNNNDFSIICTSQCDYRDRNLLERFLQHLRETS